jgi:hypothetical protein
MCERECRVNHGGIVGCKVNGILEPFTTPRKGAPGTITATPGFMNIGMVYSNEALSFYEN